MKINTHFSASCIGRKISIENNIIKLELASENNSIAQYFYFEIEHDFLEEQSFIIANAGESQYKKGWNNYSIFYSYDNKKWLRVKESYFNKKSYSFSIKISQGQKNIFLAWYQPYSIINYNNFIQKYNLHNSSIKENILIELGNKSSCNTIVLLARQHPGETMSSFFLEGFIESLLQEKDVLNNYKFIIFPLLNTKGVESGCHRFYNGIDYNRSWGNSDIEEIVYIKKFLKNKNIELVIDIHGDEVSKINFARKNSNKKQNYYLDQMSKNLENFFVLNYISLWKRIIKKLLSRNSTRILGISAETYFNNKKIPTITLELSASFNPEFHRKYGKNIVSIFKKIK